MEQEEGAIAVCAKVVNVIHLKDETLIIIQYYGHFSANSDHPLHKILVDRKSDWFAEARKLKSGDEVMAFPCQNNELWQIFRHNWLKRWWIKTMH